MAFADAIPDQNNALAAFNDSNDVQLSMILDSAIQRTYHQLILMSEILPSKSEEEKKVQLIEFACKTWQLFLRIYALVKFKRKGHINVSNIMSFLNQQNFMFVSTANYLYDFSRIQLVNARLPNFSIPTAVDVLTTGTYPRLPTCIRERILPPEPITEDEKANTLANLNRIIQCRLSLSELPTQFHDFVIEKGHVKFSVKNEFEVMLTVVSDDYKKPWRLLHIKILVRHPQDPNRSLVHPNQVYYIHDLLQKRLYESDKPLLDLFRSLHFFCQSLKLEILFQQMVILNEITSGRFYKICEYANSKQITIKYWLEYSKNEYDFRLTIMTGESTDCLQTMHYPPLNWNDHKDIDCILKSNQILVEKLLHQVVRIRSKRRLLDLKAKFTSIGHCSSTIDDEKPSLIVKFMNSTFENEKLTVMIDYYSGLFYVNIPFVPSNFPLMTQIEACLNNDISKLDSNILKLRTWFMLKRCEISLRHLSYKAVYDLPIVSFGDDETANFFSKIEKNRLFFQLKKSEKCFMMITCKTKEDLSNSKEEINWHENAEFIEDENAIRLNYYILKFVKCKYEGDIDPVMQYFKLMSISHLKRNAIMSFLDFSSESPSNDFDNNYLSGNGTYEITSNGCIYEVIKLVSSIEDRLPLLNFITILSKQNTLTQSVQIDDKLANGYLNILNPPKLETKEMQAISEHLWKKILKCKIRKIDHKHVNTVYSSTTGTKMSYSRFNYSIEYQLREKIFENRLQQVYLNDLSQYFYGNFDNQQYNAILNSHQQMQNENLNVESKALNIDSYVLYVEVKNIEEIHDVFKLEWFCMCQMYKLIRHIYKAFKQYPELKKQIRVLNFNFKQLVIAYGYNFGYKMTLQWSKENKIFDISLSANINQNSLNAFQQQQQQQVINEPIMFNHQVMLIHEIRKLFNLKQMNIVNLIQILNEACLPVYSLTKLHNLPKFYAYQQTVVPLAGFMLLIISVTHFKLTYYSRYCLEVHIHNNGLVSIRDGSFGLTDMNMAIEDLHPIQLLSAFLHKFWDNDVEELLKRRSSMVEDDNPMSPIQNVVSNQNLYQQQQQQQQPYNQQQQQHNQGQNYQSQHVFLPPTSPAVRPSIPPSPIHNYIAQSPSGVSQGGTQVPSIAPSPGSFQNFGSPAIMSHSSPSAPPHSNMQHAVPSPVFMSPAPTGYSVQSPAAPYEFQMQSPMQSSSSMPIKSPFSFVGPSPSQNANSGINMPVKDSLEEITKSANSMNKGANAVGTHYKKYYSASIPIYLSHNGFMKMLAVTPEIAYSPLETFLASNHLKKALLKFIQNESFRQIPEHNTSLISFAAKLLKIQIVNEITLNYAAFSLNITPLMDQLQTEILQEYFHAKILCPPYRTTAALAYFILLNIPELKVLKDFMQLLDYELNTTYSWRIKFSWTIPYNYNHRLKNSNNPLSMHFSTYGPGFLRKDNKYYFLMNFIQVPSLRIQTPQTLLPFLICYDSMTNQLASEYIKLTNDPLTIIENRAFALISQVFESFKMRNEPNVLTIAFHQILSTLNQPAIPSTPMPAHLQMQ